MLEDPAYHPPEEIYSWTVAREKGPERPEQITLDFLKGVPVALNGTAMGGVELITTLNTLAGKHGIGRSNMVEDRILGLKAREIYEHPAATVILAAHADLEQLTLTRQELAFKKTVDEKWSELAYMGLVHEPLFHDLSAFIETSQEKVTGQVDLSLYKGCCRVLGRSSPEAIYSEELVSFDSAVLSQTHATGVSAYYGIQARMITGKKKR